MSLFRELFGFEDAPKPSAKIAPDDPFDDWRWRYSPPSAASTEICNKIEHAALVGELLGEHNPEKVFLGDPDALARFRKMAPVATPTFTAPALVKFAGKVEGPRKRAPERKQAIAGMLTKFKAKLGGGGSLEAWDRLQASCENYVQRAIMEVA